MAENKETLSVGEIENDIKKLLNIGSFVKDSTPIAKDEKGVGKTCKEATNEPHRLNKIAASNDEKKDVPISKYSYAMPDDMVEVINVDKKKIKRKKKSHVKDSKDSDEEEENAVYLSALEKDYIFPLKNKPKKNVEPGFFCRLCNAHLTKEGIAGHVEDEDHLWRLKNATKKGKHAKAPQEKPQTKLGGKQEVKTESRPTTKTDSRQAEKTESKHGVKTETEAVSKSSPKLSLYEMDEKTPHQDVCTVLEKEKIFPLKKKSLRFPKAKFFCRLCDYHMDAVVDCQKHCKDNRHRRRNEVSNFERKLKDIPCPSPPHLAALNDLVERIYAEKGLSEEEVRYRSDLTKALEDILTKDEHLKDIKLVLYGSSLSATGIKDSDVNIDLVVPHKANHAKALMQAFKIMKTLEEYKDVQSQFSSKVPCVLFTDQVHGLRCQLTIGSDLAQETSHLLLMYSRCDPRFKKLAVIFRYWAKICRVDCQMEGTVPAFCFAIMTVYFLQQCSPPVLPILETYEEDKKTQPKKIPTPKHLDIDQVSTQAKVWHSENTESVGGLWLKMLAFYSLTFDSSLNIVCIRQHKILPRAEKKWNAKRLAIEDPFSPKRNAARSVKSFELFEYIWDCIRMSYLYFGLPSNFSSFSEEEQNKFLARVNNNQGKKSETQITAEQGKSKESRDSGNGSDSANLQTTPAGRNTDMTGPENSQKESPECTKAASVNQDVNTDCNVCTKTDNSDKVKDGNSSTIEKSISELISQSSSVEEMAKCIVDNVLKSSLSVFHSKSSESQNNDKDKTDDTNIKGKCEEVNCGSDFVHVNKVDSSTKIKEDNLEYSYAFTLDTLSDGKGPKVLCVICEKEGHLKMSCPEDTMPELRPLPAMTKDHLRLITEVLKQVPKDFAPSVEEIRDRENIRWELEQFIQELYPTARLEMFGSSNNGFGFRHSDLDLCMTFSDLPVPENLDYVDCIEKITKKLKTHKGLYNVFPITTAKVPIIKFKHRRSQLEGDISLYNLLALHNTRMINLYSELDGRVKVLGYAFKVFAKICEIGDASRGSLSSYAYILMLIYYLQQCNPPVLPVLQELHPESEKPERIVEGWNAWYMDNTAALPKLWPHCGKNNASVGELWTGLFKFYTEEFKIDEYVVCIRQQEPLTRFEKLWNGKCVAIEDPFDLNHNLGGGLSRKMHQYIIKAFVNGRSLYCTPVHNISTNFTSPADYFFDKTRLTEGSPPNDRGCRVCSKIGHIAKECPIVLNRKEREERERERKQMEEKTLAARRKEQEREYFNQQREPQHGRNSQQREYVHNQNIQQGNNIPRAYRRSNSESQDYAPNTRQSLQRQPPPNQYPPMPVYMSSPGPQRDNRSIPNNMAPHHLSHPYPRPQGGMNITGPPSLHQLNRMPRQDPQYNMSRSPNSRHSDPRMHPTGNAGHYMQTPGQGLEAGRIVNPRNQMHMGITVPNEYYRGNNQDHRFNNPQYRGQQNRPSPRK